MPWVLVYADILYIDIGNIIEIYMVDISFLRLFLP